MHTVNSALHTAADVWYNLGLELGVDPNRLDEISSRKNGSDKDNMRAMLKNWLQTSPSRTWTDICNALRDELVARNVLADAIERNYCSGGNSYNSHYAEVTTPVVPIQVERERPPPNTVSKVRLYIPYQVFYVANKFRNFRESPIG